jgi:hypothetical protein
MGSGSFSEAEIQATLETLKKDGWHIVDDYDDFLRLAFAFRDVGLNYDEVDGIFTMSDNYKYDENLEIFEDLYPEVITFATAIYHAKKCNENFYVEKLKQNRRNKMPQPTGYAVSGTAKNYLNERCLEAEKYSELITSQKMNPYLTADARAIYEQQKETLNQDEELPDEMLGDKSTFTTETVRNLLSGFEKMRAEEIEKDETIKAIEELISNFTTAREKGSCKEWLRGLTMGQNKALRFGLSSKYIWTEESIRN